MHSPSLGNTIKKHPALSSGALFLSAFLSAFIGAKLAHYLPLQNLDKQYLEELRANDFNLSPLVREYLKINPYNIDLARFGSDTLIIIDNTSKKTFTITCPKQPSTGTSHPPGYRVCLIRDNPWVLPLTESVFGGGNAIPESFVTLPIERVQPKPKHSRGKDLNNI